MARENSSLIISAIDLVTHTIQELMIKFNVTGGQLAVNVDGELHRRNFGYADNGTTPVNDHHMFRVASNTKPLTAIAVLKLVEEQQLSLGDHPFCDPQVFGCNAYCSEPGILANLLTLPANLTTSAEQCSVTILDLLLMAAGRCEHPPLPHTACATQPTIDTLDYKASYQALLLFNKNISSSDTLPATLKQVIAVLSSTKVQYPPGSSYNYCNSCYDILLLIIEAITKKLYQSYILSLLRPFGITQPRVGFDFKTLDNEVQYFPQPPAKVPSIYPPISTANQQHLNPPAHGGSFSVEHLRIGDAGIVMSATEMVNIHNLLGEPSSHYFPGRAGILQIATLDAMVARPNISVWNSTDGWFGMGLEVDLFNGTRILWKDGELAGTFSVLGNFQRTIDNHPPIIFGFVANTNLDACDNDNCAAYFLELFKLTTQMIRYNKTYVAPPLPNITSNDVNYFANGGSGRFQTPVHRPQISVLPIFNKNSVPYNINFPYISVLSALGENVLVSSLTSLITSLMLKHKADKETAFFVTQICYISYLSAMDKITNQTTALYYMSEFFRAMGFSMQQSLQLSQLIQLAVNIVTFAPTNIFGLVICVMSIATALLTNQISTKVARAINGVQQNSSVTLKKTPAITEKPPVTMETPALTSDKKSERSQDKRNPNKSETSRWTCRAAMFSFNTVNREKGFTAAAAPTRAKVNVSEARCQLPR